MTMMSVERDVRKLSHTLLWRGAALLALGSSAVIWPEEALIPAMIAVGVIATLSAVYEITIAVSMRRHTPRWWMVIAEAGTVLAFGAMTIGVTGVSLAVGLSIVAGWLLVYAGMVWSTAIVERPAPVVRWALVLWGAADLLLATLAVVYAEATIFALLFFGAVYAALFGAWQVAVAFWLRTPALTPR